MDDCIFCKIVKGELPSYKVYEDENFLAFLDIFPVKKGQTVIVTKQHYTSKVTEVPEDILKNLIAVTRKVAASIESKLADVERCQIVFEGFHTNHLHAKLFPAFNPDPAKDAVVHMGERADEKDLEEILNKIKL
jgi:histidine triad (HIT) family protein